MLINMWNWRCWVFNERKVRRNFKKFENGQTDLWRQEDSCRPTVIDNGRLKLSAIQTNIRENYRIISGDLSQRYEGIYTKSGKYRVKATKFLIFWQITRRKEICQILIENPQNERFFRQIVTTDEKWIYFRNSDKSDQWVDWISQAETQAKRCQFEKK